MQWSLMGSSESRDTGGRTLRVLYEEQAGPLYTYVLRLVGGDRHRAEDIIQETLLRCWSKQDLSVGAALLRPWLFRVARNLVIDGHRRRLARPCEIDGSNWLREMSADADEIENVLRSVVVGEAFRALSEAHRDVLYETYFVGRTTQEAAAALGIPPGTVKSRAYYALRSLRLALEERGVVTTTATAPQPAASPAASV
ncbi:sigma-70 family RNA polymerase sigma factor [Streptomyces anulatus]|uniref:Sigma-70 family RNA polymerase sigma factor n=2 Tax=Streptomyces anulatus TaxID=1892 RepID=A0A7K3R756_STRAQ|nr:sigma-70 family RNA polymerase sigma factor [Streptomyces anulatus]NEB98009.1 sigma-70 family RNA polymerase sigma factor [Streptomyces anulatus]NED29974.1 sigma-70 family RNA polymerase sigma factor [Streptomyces anulatus]